MNCARWRASFVWIASFAMLLGFQLDQACGQMLDQASDDGIWKSIPARNVMSLTASRGVGEANQVPRFKPRTYRLVELQLPNLKKALQRAPAASTTGLTLGLRPNATHELPATITLPMPDGGFERFKIEQSDTVPAELSDEWGGVKAYRGYSLDLRGRSLSLVVGPAGVRAQILTETGTIIIDPFAEGGVHATFEKAAARTALSRFNCLVKGEPAAEAAAAARAAARSPLASGTALRTYRIAVACTGEYATFHGGTKPSVGLAVATTIARVSQIYERELSIRLRLVPNNSSIIFLNASTDPFDGNDDAGVLIDESQEVIDDKIGNANYDIGHTFSTGAGGLAGLGVVCRTGQKASGVTGSSNPIGDPFDVDYVAHEIGHQFGGNHTFNGTGGSCSGDNRNGGTAYEPGSGSTIQAYAGICDPNNLQPNSDDYFHTVSLDEMIAYSTTGAGNGVTAVSNGNTPPTVDGGDDFTIPKSTPFKLTARGFDADGDPLTYCWEQFDLSSDAAALNAMDNGKIPLFRSLRPSSNASRTFPQLAVLLSGSASTAEKLPTKARSMKLRVTVRDNRMGGGGIGGDEVLLTVHAAAGPFKVSAPAAGATVSGLTEVKWDVAKTNLAPINTQFVNIALSLDDGNTFTPVASNTLNDGQEWIALPNSASTAARIQVTAVDNVYFAISPKFSIATSHFSVVVVRHAEKDTGADPELTTAGKKRATSLQLLLANAGIAEVYSTDTKRTRQTAQPLATSNGLTITNYSDHEDLATTLAALQDGRRVLVVGHSDTIQPFLTKLGVAAAPTIGEDEFDHLLIALKADSGAPKLEKRKYAATATIGPALTLGGSPTAALAKESQHSNLDAKLKAIEIQLQAIQAQLREILGE